jgi:hypothetical protein
MLSLLLPLADKTPTDNDVVAGPWGFLIFALLLLAVAFLGWSFRKQLKKADAAAEAGLYDPSDSTKSTKVTIPLADEKADKAESADAPGE